MRGVPQKVERPKRLSLAEIQRSVTQDLKPSPETLEFVIHSQRFEKMDRIADVIRRREEIEDETKLLREEESLRKEKEKLRSVRLEQEKEQQEKEQARVLHSSRIRTTDGLRRAIADLNSTTSGERKARYLIQQGWPFIAGPVPNAAFDDDEHEFWTKSKTSKAQTAVLWQEELLVRFYYDQDDAAELFLHWYMVHVADVQSFKGICPKTLTAVVAAMRPAIEAVFRHYPSAFVTGSKPQQALRDPYDYRSNIARSYPEATLKIYSWLPLIERTALPAYQLRSHALYERANRYDARIKDDLSLMELRLANLYATYNKQRLRDEYWAKEKDPNYSPPKRMATQHQKARSFPVASADYDPFANDSLARDPFAGM